MLRVIGHTSLVGNNDKGQSFDEDRSRRNPKMWTIILVIYKQLLWSDFFYLTFFFSPPLLGFFFDFIFPSFLPHFFFTFFSTVLIKILYPTFCNFFCFLPQLFFSDFFMFLFLTPIFYLFAQFLPHFLTDNW